jgi:hypothetical protein
VNYSSQFGCLAISSGCFHSVGLGFALVAFPARFAGSDKAWVQQSGHHYGKKGHKSAHFALHMLIVNYVDAGGLWLYLTAWVSDFDMECI